jgi:hypothetical protein
VSQTHAVLDVTALLQPERATLLTLLRGFTAEQWALPTECPAWDVKGLALHILGDDVSLLSRQRDASLNSLALFALDHPGMSFRELLDGFNEQWVTATTFFSTELVIELLRLVGEWSDAFYLAVGLETMSSEPVGFFAESEPSLYWQLIAREYAERIILQSQIRRAVGAPDLGGELLVGQARVAMHALAAWLRGHDAPDGAAIAMTFDGVGTWTWRHDGGGWSVVEGDAAADARVTIAADRVVPVLTRGISVTEARAATTVSGDAALADGALAIATPLLVGL